MTYHPGTFWPRLLDEHGVHYVAGGGDPERYRDQVEWLAPVVSRHVRGGRVLDFGCGPGRFRSAVEASGAEYVGVDLIPGLGTEPLGSELPGGGFDAALAIFVLQHITDEALYDHWLEELFGCLNPDGFLLVVDAYTWHRGQWRPEHMEPRGLRRIELAQPWSGVRNLTPYRDHWVAKFYS